MCVTLQEGELPASLNGPFSLFSICCWVKPMANWDVTSNQHHLRQRPPAVPKPETPTWPPLSLNGGLIECWWRWKGRERELLQFIGLLIKCSGREGERKRERGRKEEKNGFSRRGCKWAESSWGWLLCQPEWLIRFECALPLIDGPMQSG